jgi:acyl carrier protein
MSAAPEPATAPDAGLDDITRRVVAIWRSVLARDDIEPDSHLLDLGATSLTAVRIRSRIRAELGREVDLIDFLEHPTPRELAPIVAAASPWAGPEPWHQIDWSGGGTQGADQAGT